MISFLEKRGSKRCSDWSGWLIQSPWKLILTHLSYLIQNLSLDIYFHFIIGLSKASVQAATRPECLGLKNDYYGVFSARIVMGSGEGVSHHPFENGRHFSVVQQKPSMKGNQRVLNLMSPILFHGYSLFSFTRLCLLCCLPSPLRLWKRIWILQN